MSGRWLVDEPVADAWRQVRLILVRHAESLWNAEGLIQGQLGSGLSQRGHAQARRAAAYLRTAHRHPDVVVASDLERVALTAAPYAEATGLTVHDDKRLREIDNGVWSGRATDDVVAEFPDDIAAIRRGEDIARGGGETFAEMRARVDAALGDVVLQVVGAVALHATGTAVVFTHGGPIRVAVAQALGLPPGGHRLLDTPDNCSITELTVLVDAAGARLETTLSSYARLLA